MSPEQNERVEELFAELVVLDPVEQAKRLAREADEAVRREVATLLGFVDLQFLGRMTGGGRERVYLPAQGVAGRYEIIAELSRGGMGIVYRARGLVLRREVAYKIVNEATADIAHFRRKFDREARITARFQYPGIAPVYEFVTDDSGQPAYAMQLIDGVELAGLLHNRPAADAATRRGWLTAGLAACRVVAHAHAHGFVHGDLSPRNLMIVGDDAAYVLDWGLARYVGSGDDVASADDLDDLIADSPGAGSPGYTAPNIRAGMPRTRTDDVYSLGAILAAMLHGVDEAGRPRPPAIPATPGERPIRAIIDRATAAEGARRYGDALSLANDLARYLAGEPVSAYIEPWTDQLARSVRRRPVRAISAVASALLFLTVVAAAASVRGASDREAARAAEARAARQQADASRANAAMLQCGMILGRHPPQALLTLGTIHTILEALGKLSDDSPLVAATKEGLEIQERDARQASFESEVKAREAAESELRIAIASLERLDQSLTDPILVRYYLARSYYALSVLELTRIVNGFGLIKYIQITLGNVQGRRADLPEVKRALEKFDRALALLPTTFPEGVDRKECESIQVGSYIANGVGLCLLGRFTEGMIAFDQGAATVPVRGRQFLKNYAILFQKAAEVEQQYLPWSVSAPPDHDRATRMADYLVDRPEVSPEAVFNAACAFALASRDAATTASQRECRARRAVDLLATLQVGGYFRAEDKAGELQTDTTLDPIRGRTDFRGLAGRVAADRWAAIVAGHAWDLASARSVIPVGPDPVRARLIAYLAEMIWPSDPS